MGRRITLLLGIVVGAAACQSPQSEARELSAEVPKPRPGSQPLDMKEPPKGFRMAKDGKLVPNK